MYARLVTSHFKPDQFQAATRMFQDDLIPMLKSQKGFRDEISFYNEDFNEGYAISFWDNKEFADKYEQDLFPKIVEKLGTTLTDKPSVKGFEVANSTWYGIHAN